MLVTALFGGILGGANCRGQSESAHRSPGLDGARGKAYGELILPLNGNFFPYCLTATKSSHPTILLLEKMEHYRPPEGKERQRNEGGLHNHLLGPEGSSEIVSEKFSKIPYVYTIQKIILRTSIQTQIFYLNTEK
jgi:hypothetical protein